MTGWRACKADGKATKGGIALSAPNKGGIFIKVTNPEPVVKMEGQGFKEFWRKGDSCFFADQGMLTVVSRLEEEGKATVVLVEYTKSPKKAESRQCACGVRAGMTEKAFLTLANDYLHSIGE